MFTLDRNFDGPVFLNLIRHSDGIEFDVLSEPRPMISACHSDVYEGSYWYQGDLQSAIWFLDAALHLVNEGGSSPSDKVGIVKSMFAKAEFIIAA